jgi:hypothetical protein
MTITSDFRLFRTLKKRNRKIVKNKKAMDGWVGVVTSWKLHLNIVTAINDAINAI